MDLKEFSALKVGDEVESMNGSRGRVIETNASGVSIAWGIPQTTQHPFFYSVRGTSWFHWTKVTSWFHWTKVEPK